MEKYEPFVVAGLSSLRHFSDFFSQMGKTVQCLFCPDYLPEPRKKNESQSSGYDDFDSVYSSHMERHENFMFCCKICSEASLAPPDFLTLKEATDHVKATHQEKQSSSSSSSMSASKGPDLMSLVIFPTDLAVARCRRCLTEIICSNSRTVVKHLLDHNVDLKSVSSENSEFYLGCRICKFETLDWSDWQGHFQSTNYLCRSRGIQKTSANRLAEVSKLFSCNVCCRAFQTAEQLQKHFVDPHHFKMRMNNPDVLFRCAICQKDVTTDDFMEHVASQAHRSKLRSIEIGDKPAKMPAKTPAETLAKAPAKLPAKPPAKTPAKPPAKIPAEAPAMPPAKKSSKGPRAPNPNYYCHVCHVQCRDQHDFMIHSSQPEHLSRIKPQDKETRTQKYSCPFCIEHDLPDIAAHIDKAHQGEYFVCSHCSEKTIYMDLLAAHIKEHHRDRIQLVQVRLPANPLFFVCCSCHSKGSLRGDSSFGPLGHSLLDPLFHQSLSRSYSFRCPGQVLETWRLAIHDYRI